MANNFWRLIFLVSFISWLLVTTVGWKPSKELIDGLVFLAIMMIANIHVNYAKKKD